MRLGKPGVAGTGHDTFNMPSDVLVRPMATSSWLTDMAACRTIAS